MWIRRYLETAEENCFPRRYYLSEYIDWARYCADFDGSAYHLVAMPEVTIREEYVLQVVSRLNYRDRAEAERLLQKLYERAIKYPFRKR